jgi:hypothetical protein
MLDNLIIQGLDFGTESLHHPPPIYSYLTKWLQWTFGGWRLEIAMVKCKWGHKGGAPILWYWSFIMKGRAFKVCSLSLSLSLWKCTWECSKKVANFKSRVSHYQNIIFQHLGHGLLSGTRSDVGSAIIWLGICGELRVDTKWREWVL